MDLEFKLDDEQVVVAQLVTGMYVIGIITKEGSIKKALQFVPDLQKDGNISLKMGPLLGFINKDPLFVKVEMVGIVADNLPDQLVNNYNTAVSNITKPSISDINKFVK